MATTQRRGTRQSAGLARPTALSPLYDPIRPIHSPDAPADPNRPG